MEENQSVEIKYLRLLQLKIYYYKYEVVYIILETNTKQTPILDTKIRNLSTPIPKQKKQKPSYHKGRQQDMKEQKNYNAARE